MEEVRLWRVVEDKAGEPRIASVESVDATATERLLEDVLTHSPEALLEGLRIIGRQNNTDTGPLDLLGIDEDGQLVVFELKRGELRREAVAQVLDYASQLSALDTEELDSFICKMSGRYGVEKLDSFTEWYRTQFTKNLSDIGKPRMILVGLGADAATKRMVEFLSASGVDMSLITFYGFRANGETLLARKVEVEAKDDAQKVRATRAANEERLAEKLKELGLELEYEQLTGTLRKALGDECYVLPNAGGRTFYYPERTDSDTPTLRAYVGLSVPDSLGKARKILVTLQQRAVAEIGKDPLDSLAKELQASVSIKKSGYAELILDTKRPLTELSSGLQALGDEVLRAWKRRLQDSKASVGETH